MDNGFAPMGFSQRMPSACGCNSGTGSAAYRNDPYQNLGFPSIANGSPVDQFYGSSPIAQQQQMAEQQQMLMQMLLMCMLMIMMMQQGGGGFMGRGGFPGMGGAQRRLPDYGGGSPNACGPGSGIGPGGGIGPGSGINGAPPGSGAASAVDWALGEARKGINESQHQGYISQNYCGGRNQPWCADFVSTALARGGVRTGTSSVSGLRAWGQRNGCYFSNGQGMPKPGDVVLFQNGMSHAGIVTRVENGRIYTVEGNSSNAVKERSYPINSGRITGYVRAFA